MRVLRGSEKRVHPLVAIESQRPATVPDHRYEQHMKSDPNAGLPEPTTRAKSLAKVLEENEHVKELVKESVEELSLIIAVTKQDLSNRDPLAGVEHAIAKSAAVESKLREVSEKLTVVNRALEGEVRERGLIDHQLAATIEQERGARYAAFHDVLTGLPNRLLFNDRLEHGIAQAKRHGWTLAVMFVDLDKFKSVNDTYGHNTGDIVLQTMAQRLKKNTRGDDTVSRHGGDEFLYLLTEIHDEKDIAMIAEKIIKMIEVPCNISVQDLTISPSIGACIGISIYPRNGTTADTLIKRADEAMYWAKQHKSRYSFAS
jgi:diguanylate cyclase (GGDEF)-like protein